MEAIAYKREPSKVSTAKVPVIARQVYTQLLSDFPAMYVDWIKRNSVIGPLHIDLDEIDFSTRNLWTASSEPKKVKKHQELIEEGKNKPIILGQLPGTDKLTCLDGHHRLLAFEALGKEPLAYIVDVRPADVEAALKMHNFQYSGGSRLNGT